MTGKKLLVQVVVEGEKGGAGSGNFGHSGRPGKLGGSIPKGAGGGAGTGSQTYRVNGKIVPVTGPFTAVVAAKQNGEISKDWRYHSQEAGKAAPLMLYTRKLQNGDALEIAHSQGSYRAIKFDGATEKRTQVGEANTPLAAIKLAEASIKTKPAIDVNKLDVTKLTANPSQGSAAVRAIQAVAKPRPVKKIT